MVRRRQQVWLVAVLACVVAGASAQSALAARTVALWHMDERSGTSMLDAVGGHTGTLQNVQLGVPGFAGTAYNFAGKAQVTVPTKNDLNAGAANLRVTIRVKATSAPKTPDWDLIRKGQYTTPGGEFKMEYQPNGAPSCGFKGSKYGEVFSTASIKDGRWHTVQCVKTASAISVVVDGRAATKAIAIGSIANTAPIVVAAYP